MNTTTELINLIQTTTINQVAIIAAENGIDFDNSTIAGKLVDTRKEWIDKIIKEAKQDAEAADLMGGLKKNRIDPLVKSAFTIGLKHACLKYAQFLLNVA